MATETHTCAQRVPAESFRNALYDEEGHEADDDEEEEEFQENGGPSISHVRPPSAKRFCTKKWAWRPAHRRLRPASGRARRRQARFRLRPGRFRPAGRASSERGLRRHYRRGRLREASVDITAGTTLFLGSSWLLPPGNLRRFPAPPGVQRTDVPPKCVITGSHRLPLVPCVPAVSP